MVDLKPLLAGAVCLIYAAVTPTSQAAMAPNPGLITFDSPGYVAGSIAPFPWQEASHSTSGWGVVAGAGDGGTQGLAIDYPNTVTYNLPVISTPAMGAQQWSILFDPAGPSSNANFLDYGGMQIGGDSYFLGVIFRKQGAGTYGIYGPGGTPGTYMGSFTPDAQPNWYEITFEINQAWDTMTLSAGPVDGKISSMQYAWDGSPITWVRPVRGDTQFTSAPAIYDNLSIPVPEPAALILMSLGGWMMIHRRSRA